MRVPNAFNTMSSAATSCSNSTTRIRLRKTKAAGGNVTTKLPHQVLRRNERERKRVQQVNLGFIHLRDRVPHSSTSKKLSKVETLREAARYIKHLQDLLQGTCDKPFEPLNANQESHNYYNDQCFPQENHHHDHNHHPLQHQTPDICQFTSCSESFYYQSPQNVNNSSIYYKSSNSSFNFDSINNNNNNNGTILKSENDSSNILSSLLSASSSLSPSSSSHSSSSLNFTEISRFQRTDYVL